MSAGGKKQLQIVQTPRGDDPLNDGWPCRACSQAMRYDSGHGRLACIDSRGEFVTDRRGRLVSPRGAGVDRIILFIAAADGQYNERRRLGEQRRSRLDRGSMCQPRREPSATRRPLLATGAETIGRARADGDALGVATQLNLTDRRLTA